MKCKNIFGMKICKLNSSTVISFPQNIQNKVPVTLYTSKECKICKNILSEQLKILSNVKELINQKVVNIEDLNSIPQKISTLPSLQIGENVLDSITSTKDILMQIKRNLPSN